MDGIRQIREKQRKAVEMMYDGVCTVTEHCKVTNPETHLTHFEDVVVWENQPCRLSFESRESVKQSESAAGTSQSIKLFLAPEISIKAGSRIRVTQNGVTADYTHSGVPAVYASHQEIRLELFKEYA